MELAVCDMHNVREEDDEDENTKLVNSLMLWTQQIRTEQYLTLHYSDISITFVKEWKELGNIAKHLLQNISKEICMKHKNRYPHFKCEVKKEKINILMQLQEMFGISILLLAPNKRMGIYDIAIVICGKYKCKHII